MKTIHVETELPTDADRVWQAMKHPAALLYVTRGLFGFPALAGQTSPFQEGDHGAARLTLFHVIPLWRHTMRLIELDDATRTMRSREHGGTVRAWNHTLHAEPIGPDRCRYSDTVEIDGGPFTAVTVVIATFIYRYRQRRWHKLVHKHLMATGPCYARR
ncbi:hypothetical protein J4573_24295 [Actinomadura barringtoniae]|uniref:SRPBCC family protein n=1 Tax=Actinomadura barringtoniae TaxID=1427535 RepID=A0A939PHK9_9ACTN|nr:hypothetical protein [Actinomadura barringtoniae]MBO2450243.1 hypothetical protein [Actinomadura barringtoniae]